MSYGNYKGPHTVDPTAVPHTQALPGDDQIKNSAGGYVYKISDLDRFTRFLILGSDTGSYYATPRELTHQNAENIIRVVKKYGKKAIDIIVEVSKSGRAPKNNPALFALAVAASAKEEELRRYALDNLHRVARTATHLFDFLSYVKEFRGWGRMLQKAVGAWYNEKDPERLAYQIIKYRQRNGWTHHDVLKLAHPRPKTSEHGDIYRWIKDRNPDVANQTIQLFRMVQDKNISLDTLLSLIATGKLPWEALPTNILNEVSVWEALLPNMPTTAMLRNLGKMTAIGVFNKKQNIEIVKAVFTNQERLHKDRIHPVNLYVALRTYNSGKGLRGHLVWAPSKTITDSLETGFELAYKTLPHINGNILIALDVSGSMSHAVYNNLISARELSVAIAKALMTQMDSYTICMFSNGKDRYKDWGARTNNRAVTKDSFEGFMELKVPYDVRVFDLVSTTHQYSGMYTRTDCSIPICWASQQNKDFDAIITITDNETYAGAIHPSVALSQYRYQINKPVKNIVLAVSSTEFSIADPEDPYSLDVVGFDSNVPSLIAEFISEGKVGNAGNDES